MVIEYVPKRYLLFQATRVEIPSGGDSRGAGDALKASRAQLREVWNTGCWFQAAASGFGALELKAFLAVLRFQPLNPKP